jgi:hypothetical protein
LFGKHCIVSFRVYELTAGGSGLHYVAFVSGSALLGLVSSPLDIAAWSIARASFFNPHVGRDHFQRLRTLKGCKGMVKLVALVTSVWSSFQRDRLWQWTE